VRNNPLKYVDPSGHTYICATECEEREEQTSKSGLQEYVLLGQSSSWSSPVFKRRVSGYHHGELTFYNDAHIGTDYGPNFTLGGALTEILRSPGNGIVYRSKACIYDPCTFNLDDKEQARQARSAGANYGYGNTVDIAYSYYNLPESVATQTGVKPGQYLLLRYAHLQFLSSLNEGDTVQPGTYVGLMGTTGNSTGVHLHFEARIVSYPAQIGALTVSSSSRPAAIGRPINPERMQYFTEPSVRVRLGSQEAE
jgi:hypothetical protein